MTREKSAGRDEDGVHILWWGAVKAAQLVIFGAVCLLLVVLTAPLSITARRAPLMQNLLWTGSRQRLTVPPSLSASLRAAHLAGRPPALRPRARRASTAQPPLCEPHARRHERLARARVRAGKGGLHLVLFLAVRVARWPAVALLWTAMDTGCCLAPMGQPDWRTRRTLCRNALQTAITHTERQ